MTGSAIDRNGPFLFHYTQGLTGCQYHLESAALVHLTLPLKEDTSGAACRAPWVLSLRSICDKSTSSSVKDRGETHAPAAGVWPSEISSLDVSAAAPAAAATPAALTGPVKAPRLDLSLLVGCLQDLPLGLRSRALTQLAIEALVSAAANLHLRSSLVQGQASPHFHVAQFDLQRPPVAEHE